MGGWIYFVIELGLLGSSQIYPSTGNPYNPFTSFIGVTIMTFIMGISLGAIEEQVIKHQLKQYPFSLKILLKTALYVVVVVGLLLTLAVLLNAHNMRLPFYHKEVFATVFSFLSSFTFLSIVIFSGVIIGLSLFFSEIVDFLGLDVVSSFFNGKYATSVIEDRIFMFLDMKGSTTIAERIGHEKHYSLINDYYSDMTDPIIQTRGHIYQYVGDEIVIFWEAKEGLNNANCIDCFFLIKHAIQERTEYYDNTYGVTPTFKAGIHLGKVTRGQVGLIKRELLFTGDVLNTTARIQNKCNELNTDLLISEDLRKILPRKDYQFENKGYYNLRGKNKRVILFGVVFE